MDEPSSAPPPRPETPRELLERARSAAAAAAAALTERASHLPERRRRRGVIGAADADVPAPPAGDQARVTPALAPGRRACAPTASIL